MGAHARAGMVRLWGLLSLSAGFGLAHPLVPEHANLVLFAGVPGDVESETAFREQMQVVASSAATRGAEHCFVLCDAPENSGLAAEPKVTVLKGDRSTFLSLTNSVGASTNPLVVIAWGHGGRQGGQPVFHVRGPRITVGDFREVMGSARGEKTCVLLFRSSGFFARELESAGSRVLSSDYDTGFDSDPVAMELLAESLRKGPAMELEALARELGGQVVAWYAERNLARTEEPTLWEPGKKAQLLAPGSKEIGAAAAPESPGEAEPSARAPDNAAAEDNATELPEYWRHIRKAKPQDYPEAAAVILQRSVSYTLGTRPAVSAEQEELIQIVTPEGKSAGDFDIGYSPPFEEIRFLDCEVLSPEGKLTRLDPESIREAMEQTVGDYQVGRRKIFSLPGVVPGALLHVRYRSQWRDFPLPRISLEIPIGKQAPARECVVRVSVPKETPFHFAVERIASGDPEISSSAYASTYTWRFANVPGNKNEPLAPPRHGSRLLISTFGDWAEFADWYGRITQMADEATPEIQAKASEITRDAKTDGERVVALYNYVACLRYVAVPMGINSFRPHAAANVLKNGFGDCKDKANLFNTLLHSLHIDAHLVLVPRFSQAHESIPGLAFNHAISRLTVDGEALWVDTTDDVCRFGMLPPGDAGRNVLVIDGQSKSLLRLPLPDAADHRLEIEGKLDCSGGSPGVRVSIEVRTSGYPDYELRSTAREARERGASLPFLAARFRPAAGSFAMTSQHASSVAALDENFWWRAEGTCVGLSSTDRDQSVLHAPFWLPREWDMALNQRESPLFLNQGYPLVLDEQFEIALPANRDSLAVPVLAENSGAPLKWRLEWKQTGSGKVLARLRAELTRGELELSETAVFQEQLRSLLAAIAADVTFKQTP